MRRLIVLCLIFGCGKDAPVAALRDAGAETGREAAAETATTDGIVSPGAEPRQKLAYVFQKGTKTALAIETDLDRTLPTGTGPVPTMLTEYEQLVADVAADGTGTLTLTVKRVGTVAREGATVDQSHVARQAALLEGAVITVKIAPDGTVRESAITLAARDVTPAMTEEANAALAPFLRMRTLPSEPVGVGAKWRATSIETPGGVRIANRTQYEITAIAGTRISYTLTATLDGADHQTVQGPGLALDVSNIQGSGAGSGTFDLATATTTGDFAQTLQFDMTAAGEKATASLRSGYRSYGLQSAP